MSKVWLVVGWFGEHEWVESIHANEASALAAEKARWEGRTSLKLEASDYRQGLCKFGVEEWEVTG